MEETKRPRSAKLTRGNCLLFLLVIAAGIVLISKFLRTAYPPPAVPLFEPAAGMQVFGAADAAEKITGALPLPTKTFGASLYAIAHYASASPLFPAGAVDMLYAKDSARTFEILILPVPPSDAAVQKLLIGTKGPGIAIHETTGNIYASVRPFPICLDTSKDRALRVCQVGNRLAFGTETRTFIVSVDGKSLTEGELIEVARSLPLTLPNR